MDALNNKATQEWNEDIDKKIDLSVAQQKEYTRYSRLSEFLLNTTLIFALVAAVGIMAMTGLAAFPLATPAVAFLTSPITAVVSGLLAGASFIGSNAASNKAEEIDERNSFLDSEIRSRQYKKVDIESDLYRKEIEKSQKIEQAPEAKETAPENARNWVNYVSQQRQNVPQQSVTPSK